MGKAKNKNKPRVPKLPGTKKQKAPENDGEMEYVLSIGGNKDDFKMVEEVDDDGEELEVDEDDLETDPKAQKELKDFISSLGFDKLQKGINIAPDDTDEDIHESEQEEDTSPQKSKQKADDKNKNKTDNKQKNKQTNKTQEDNDSNLHDKTEDNKKKKKKKKNEKVQENIVSSSSEVRLSNFTEKEIDRKHLLVKPGGKWYAIQATEGSAENTVKPSLDVVNKLREYAQKLLEHETAKYQKDWHKRQKSEANWLGTVIKSGTLQDKVAAYTLLVQESPIHNTKSLEALLNMVKKKGKREALAALDTLKELFISDLVPESRKLRSFTQNPLIRVEQLSSGNKDSRDLRLLCWWFESQMKDMYHQFVEALSTLSQDTVTMARKKALGAVYDLLVNVPEQEQALLSMLVNKLGDPDLKVASKGAHLLTQLVGKHPNMKAVVVEEVERLLYRPNVSSKAQYYGVCFLNQIVLKDDDTDLAAKLIKLYFSFFKVFVKQGEVDSKMLSALLTGVNRAYPYAKVDLTSIEEEVGTLYKVVHAANFNTSVQALMLLHQTTDAGNTVSDRYYSALYRKISDPALGTSSKQPLFLNLLYKSMKKDVFDKRVQAFIKRLLQVCSHHQPTFICGALILLSEVLKAKPSVLRFSKRSQVMADDDDDDEEEVFKDVPLEEEEAVSSGEEGEGKTSPVKPGTSSWVHRHYTQRKTDTSDYDPQHRNPLYCRAENDCVWELTHLCHHFHPSVALFAKNILEGHEVQYSGDPLADFTLIHFLDRFVYRNPKTKDKLPKTAMRRRGQHEPSGARAVAVNTDRFLHRAEKNIPVDERFFYRYFAREAEKKSRPKDYDSDADSVDDDEFDDYLDKFESNLDERDPDFDFDDMDFASEMDKITKSKRSKKTEDGESDEDSDLDLSDEEVDFGGDDDFSGSFADMDGFGEDDDEDNLEGDEDEDPFEDDELALEGSSGDEEDMFEEKAPASKGKRKRGLDSLKKLGNSKKLKKGGLVDSSLFAAAEEFAHLIDDNADDKMDTTTSEAVSNTDKASMKQLKWEAERDRQVRGKDWRQQKGRKPKKQFNKTQGGKKQFNKRNKAQKGGKRRR